MENITIINTNDFQKLMERFNTVEGLILQLFQAKKAIETPHHSDVPDFISVKDAILKYHVSEVTIYKKLKLFKAVNGREVDRTPSGQYKLINKAELIQALALKGDYRGKNKK